MLGDCGTVLSRPRTLPRTLPRPKLVVLLACSLRALCDVSAALRGYIIDSIVPRPFPEYYPRIGERNASGIAALVSWRPPIYSIPPALRIFVFAAQQAPYYIQR